MLNNLYVSKGYINNLNKMLLRPKKAVSLYEIPARNRFEDQSLELIGMLPERERSDRDPENDFSVAHLAVLTSYRQVC